MTKAQILKRLSELADYINEQARISDAESHKWEKSKGGKTQAAYRSGMWYGYNDVRNRLMGLR